MILFKKSWYFQVFFVYCNIYKNKEMDEITKLKKALIECKTEINQLRKELEIVKEYLRKQHLLKSKTK